MAAPSRLEILNSNPIGEGLSSVRNSFNTLCRDLNVSDKKLKDLAVHLIIALQGLPVARSLPSGAGRGTLRSDLLRLELSTEADNFDIERIKPLLRAVLENEPDEVIWNRVYDAVTESTPPPRPTSSFQQTPLSINTGSFANSTEHRKHVDDVLKEELGHLYVGIPGFFEAFFEDVPGLRPAALTVFDKCMEGESPLFRVDSGWQGWPEGAKEMDVLSWFASLIDRLLNLAEGHQPVSEIQRRPLAQPYQPLQGSIADRKLDIGFVDDPNAGADSKYRWSQILIPGELKSNPSADKASKAWLDLGRYAREVLAAQLFNHYVLYCSQKL
ncbi:hypothetical protein EJ07DRAFT_159287 [Lizonia empirigonia]|nr:hypothetical protein EJ07DRAFT_159287 [Lizonia empirigonia]